MGIVSSILALALSFQFFGERANWVGPRSFTPKLENVFIPAGFDDNDLSQVIVEVEFTDACQEIGRAQIVPNEEFPNVLMLYVEGHRRDEICAQVLNRKIKVVDIGVLPAGDYEIRAFNNLDQRLGSLKVHEARSSAIDDAIYAPVDSLFVAKDPLGLRNVLVLSGTFQNNCLEFDSIKMAKTRENVNMIEVLPTVKMADRTDCKNEERPFLIQQPIPETGAGYPIKNGRYLFHVRTMNGGSFNKIDRVVMDNEDSN